jgi:hypothetical protein
MPNTEWHDVTYAGWGARIRPIARATAQQLVPVRGAAHRRYFNAARPPTQKHVDSASDRHGHGQPRGRPRCSSEPRGLLASRSTPNTQITAVTPLPRLVRSMTRSALQSTQPQVASVHLSVEHEGERRQTVSLRLQAAAPWRAMERGWPIDCGGAADAPRDSLRRARSGLASDVSPHDRCKRSERHGHSPNHRSDEEDSANGGERSSESTGTWSQGSALSCRRLRPGSEGPAPSAVAQPGSRKKAGSGMGLHGSLR